MPWLLIPFLFLLCAQISFESFHLSLQYLFLPVSVCMGLRYGERGLLALIIGSLPLLIYFTPYDSTVAIGSNNTSLFIISILLCALATEKPILFRQHQGEDLNTNLGPKWIILLLFISVGLDFEGSSTFRFGISLNSYHYLLTYLYLRGLIRSDSPRDIILVLGGALIVSVILFYKSKGHFYSEAFWMRWDYFHFSDFLEAIGVYSVGRLHANARHQNKKVCPVELLVLAFLLFLSSWRISIEAIDYTLFGSWIIIYMIAFLMGLRGQWFGVAIVMAITLMFCFLFPEGWLQYKTEMIYIRFYGGVGMLGLAIKTISFSIFGLLASQVKNKRPNRQNLSNVCSKSSSIVLFIHRFCIICLPLFLFTLGVTNIIDDSSINFLDLIDEFMSGPGIIIILGVGLVYLLINYFPILLTNEVIKRNGVVFNRKTFPEYSEIHDIIERDYGKKHSDLYVIDEATILQWSFAKRVYKIFALTNPVLTSSCLAAVKDNPKQLLFLIHRQMGKTYLGHQNLWWYTYILTFIPPFTFFYLYAKRLTTYQSMLHAYERTHDFHSATLAVAAEGCNTQITQLPSKPKSWLFSDSMIWILELFSAEPNLQNKISWLKNYHEGKESLELTPAKYGYRLSSKRQEPLSLIARTKIFWGDKLIYALESPVICWILSILLFIGGVFALQSLL